MLLLNILYLIKIKNLLNLHLYLMILFINYFIFLNYNILIFFHFHHFMLTFYIIKNIKFLLKLSK